MPTGIPYKGWINMDVINKKKLKDEVFASLQKAIVEGELKPGERIVETKIAADMGVSQATVREALKELEFYGLTENISYQGTYVKRLTKSELKEAYDAREVLEEYAVGEAAKRITKKPAAGSTYIYRKDERGGGKKEISVLLLIMTYIFMKRSSAAAAIKSLRSCGTL